MADSETIKGGFFIIARQLFYGPIWQRDANTLKLFLFLVGRARFVNGNGEARGELTTSYGKLAKELNMSVKVIRNRLAWLVEERMIQTEPIRDRGKPKGRPLGKGEGQGVGAYLGLRIKIIKFERYQDMENYRGKPSGQTNGQASGHEKGQTSQDNLSELLTKKAPKKGYNNAFTKNKEQTATPSLSDLKKRYNPTLISKTLEAIRGTRKSGKVADSVLCNFLKTCAKYPVQTVEGAFEAYLDKGYAAQGKSEQYLLAIVRNYKETGKYQTPIVNASLPREEDKALFEKMARKYREANS